MIFTSHDLQFASRFSTSHQEEQEKKERKMSSKKYGFVLCIFFFSLFRFQFLVSEFINFAKLSTFCFTKCSNFIKCVDALSRISMDKVAKILLTNKIFACESRCYWKSRQVSTQHSSVRKSMISEWIGRSWAKDCLICNCEK